MKGDFSHLKFDPAENFTGVLQQQGRVLLDRDWNDQTLINGHWQGQAGRDTIGQDVAAVPVHDSLGFMVTQARVMGTGANARVRLRVRPGRIWADGLLCYLPPNSPGSTAPVARRADYYPAPIDPTPGSISTIVAGTRDAVILEVRREEINAFQYRNEPADADRLLEPALGGPDTTERIHHSLAFKLYRLAPGEKCHAIAEPGVKGRLTADLEPSIVVPGDCPVAEGGGYSGFEHYLYRIEFAAVEAAIPPSFKWSQFNGGLVGRGRRMAGPDRFVITANQAAIVNSGLSSFYLEVISYDQNRGHWFPSFGADVVLNGTELVIGTVRLDRPAAATATSFFRLWNGISPIGDFDDPAPLPFNDGIRLQFTPATGTNYAPGDFWTFKVRAGEITNNVPLVDDAPPFGPVHHRVPIAEIHWPNATGPVVPPEIEDCRRPFRPLTRLDTCCTARVGDGVTSLGDFTSIQAAIDSLPLDRGGQVCILPGEYRQLVNLTNRTNVTISGCGPRTRIIAPDPLGGAQAVITIVGGVNLAVESLAIEAGPAAGGLRATGLDPFDPDPQVATGPIQGLRLEGLHGTASVRAAIRVEHAVGLTIRECVLRMEDVNCEEHAMIVLAEESHLEHNLVEVRMKPSPGAEIVPEFPAGLHSTGGLHLKGGCEKVRVIDNLIQGGAGNGITLGSIVWEFEDGTPVPPRGVPPPPPRDPCDPFDSTVPTDTVPGDGGTMRRAPGPLLSDIRIERNRILFMGANGIGVAGFFVLDSVDEFITVRRLSILGNEIRGCLRKDLAIPENMSGFMGYGGISLADVDQYLFVHDNKIVDNGYKPTFPTCGVFVLHAEGADLSRNYIVNNGGSITDSDFEAGSGQRGGVVLLFALAPVEPMDPGLADSFRIGLPVGTGLPAARLHDNIVSAPIGRALILNGIGPMSVVDNKLTSRGIVGFDDLVAFSAGAVWIMNLGMPIALAELGLMFGILGRLNELHSRSSKGGLDHFKLGRLLLNGQVAFSDNQVTLDVFDATVDWALSSTFIVTLDDLGCHDNHFEATTFSDVLLLDACLIATTQRITGNRWSEGPYLPFISAFTFGLLMNNTSSNQATHCIVVRCMDTSLLIDQDNQVAPQLPLQCETWNELFSSQSKDPHG